MITPICDNWENFRREVLPPWGEAKTFFDGVVLAYYLQHNGPYNLAVVTADGADDMNYYGYAQHIRPGVRMLWMTQGADFTLRSQCMGADGFLVKSLPRDEPENTLYRILGPPGSTGRPQIRPLVRGDPLTPGGTPPGLISLIPYFHMEAI